MQATLGADVQLCAPQAGQGMAERRRVDWHYFSQQWLGIQRNELNRKPAFPPQDDGHGLVAFDRPLLVCPDACTARLDARLDDNGGQSTRATELFLLFGEDDLTLDALERLEHPVSVLDTAVKPVPAIVVDPSTV